MNNPRNEAVAVARRIVRARESCTTEAQLETLYKWAVLACRRYRIDFLPLLGKMT